MNWIFSRFPDETVKITSASHRKFGTHMRKIEYARVYRQLLELNRAVIVAISLSAKRIVYSRFLPETGNQKYPKNPVNPVYFIY